MTSSVTSSVAKYNHNEAAAVCVCTLVLPLVGDDPFDSVINEPVVGKLVGFCTPGFS